MDGQDEKTDEILSCKSCPSMFNRSSFRWEKQTGTGVGFLGRNFSTASGVCLALTRAMDGKW
jgi:hypothetical protein